jgi:anti-sigma regulatory factor (Ser/Thr protein kinase)
MMATMSLIFAADLSAIRQVVHRCAREAGLSETRATDLVLAVNEIAANTFQHARSAGMLDIWHDAEEIVCQVRDKGFISDPLAGRRQPPTDTIGGRGLWLVNQVCDRMELQSDRDGTTIRLHMSLRAC